ncbi:UGP2 isoform 3, partial [Pan troglodytes]
MSRFVQDLSKAMSQDGASQFQEVIRQELELSVKKELEKILTTASSHEFE